VKVGCTSGQNLMAESRSTEANPDLGVVDVLVLVYDVMKVLDGDRKCGRKL